MTGLTKEAQAKLDRYPKVELTKAEFDALPEYSLSTPTQDSSGLGVKKWKYKTPIHLLQVSYSS